MNYEATYQNWGRGDIIRHKATGDAYVVDANYGEHLTAVRTAMVSNAHEWERVFESIPMGDVDDCAVKLDGFGVPVHHISGRISFDPSKTAYAPDKGPVDVGDPVGRKDTLATRIAELREKTTAQIDDLTARNDHLVTRNGVLETEVSVLTKDNDCLERVIKTSAEEMRGKDRKIGAKQDAVDGLGQQVDARDKTITELVQTIAERELLIEDQRVLLEDADRPGGLSDGVGAVELLKAARGLHGALRGIIIRWNEDARTRYLHGSLAECARVAVSDFNEWALDYGETIEPEPASFPCSGTRVVDKELTDLSLQYADSAPRYFRLGDVFDATIDLGSIEEITGPDLVGDGWGFTLYKRGDTTGFHWKCYDTEQAARAAYAKLTAALCGEG